MTAVDLKTPETAPVKLEKPHSIVELCDRRGEGRTGEVGRTFPEAGEKVVWERMVGGTLQRQWLWMLRLSQCTGWT